MTAPPSHAELVTMRAEAYAEYILQCDRTDKLKAQLVKAIDAYHAQKDVQAMAEQLLIDVALALETSCPFPAGRVEPWL